MTTEELFKSFSKEEGFSFFNSKKSDKEIYDEFVKKGLTDSYETFMSSAEKVMKETFSKLPKEEIISQLADAELSDEQLEQIAGGKMDTETRRIVEAGTCVAAGAAGAAAL